MTSKIWDTPIEDSKKLKTEEPPKYAAGLKAVLNSMKIVNREMGMIKGTKGLLSMNQKQGFDCSGCAWPDPDRERHPFEFCENGAKALAEEAMAKVIDKDFLKEHSLLALSQLSDYELSKVGRLAKPLVARRGKDPSHNHYEEIEWDEAYALISQEMKKLKSADEAAFYTSGRTSNEAAFLYQLLARMWGTNNLPDCSNLCHESSGVAMLESIGIGKGTVTIEDLESTDLILLFGQNPGTNHPRMLSTLQAAKKRGAKIIAVNPLREAGSEAFIHPRDLYIPNIKPTLLTDLHVPVKLSGDLYLLKAIMKELWTRERASQQSKNKSVFDWEFIKKYTVGLDALLADLDEMSFDTCEAKSGISHAIVVQIADMIEEAKSMICCWAMGITQQPRGVTVIQYILNLLLLRGNIGRPGAGPCPVRGHSNVQGDRTMGIWEKPPEAFLHRLEKVFKFSSPRKHGHDVVECIHAMNRGGVRFLMCMGGNFLQASPDTEYTAKGIQKLNMSVYVSTKLNRGHLNLSGTTLILPCLVRSEKDKQAKGEQFVTVENSMGIVHASRGVLRPISTHLRSEVEIVCDMLKTLFPTYKHWSFDSLKGDYGQIRSLIEQTIEGFENFNENLKDRSFFYLPNKVRDERGFNTKSKKAHFIADDRDSLIQEENPIANSLLMMTFRSHDQYNTTIYDLNDRYRGIHGYRRIIFMNPDDMQDHALKPRDVVDITSHFKGQKRFASSFTVVPYKIPRGCTATYYPESNPLVPIDSTVPKSNTPTSKYIVVTLSKSP